MQFRIRCEQGKNCFEFLGSERAEYFDFKWIAAEFHFSREAQLWSHNWTPLLWRVFSIIYPFWPGSQKWRNQDPEPMTWYPGYISRAEWYLTQTLAHLDLTSFLWRRCSTSKFLLEASFRLVEILIVCNLILASLFSRWFTSIPSTHSHRLRLHFPQRTQIP